jgi:hypothetical protein
LLIRRHIEIGRKNSVGRGAGDLRICTLHYLGALLTETQDQLVQRLACFGRHFDSRETLVGSLSADIDLSNLEVRAVGQNLIQHLRQNQRVDDMPAQLDRFRRHLQNLAVRSGRASNGKIVVTAFAAASAESVRRLTQMPLQPNEINMEKPSARGPSPSRKAHRVL